LNDPDSIMYIFLFFLLILSAFFSLSETALMSLSKIRLLTMLEENVKGAKDIEKLVKNIDRTLSATLIGNNFANVAASTIATAAAIKLLNDDGLVLSVTTICVTIVILIICEITPKTVAVKNADKAALLIAKPLRFFVAIFWPVSVTLNFVIRSLLRLFKLHDKDESPTVTETDLKTMVNVSHEEGIIEHGEKTMIHNVFEFNDSRAKDVMIPRTDIAAVNIDTGYNEVIQIFEKERFSRLPVYRGNLDHIVGILYLRDIVFAKVAANRKKDFSISEFMRQPLFSYELKPISALLNEMRESSIQMAVILDEYGGTSGIVTLEDLIEEIVGDIYDEYDENSNEIEQLDGNEYSVDGSLKIDGFNELCGTDFKSDDYESIGGFVVGLLDKMPEDGEIAETDGVIFTVETTAKNRIEKLRVTIKPQ